MVNIAVLEAMPRVRIAMIARDRRGEWDTVFMACFTGCFFGWNHRLKACATG